jgi:DNA-binding LacI/PurR family transcriptional regulator
VLNGRPCTPDNGIFSVDADNVDGGRQATDVLLVRGARSIATITGPLDMSVGQDRLAGYQQALEAAGRPYRGSAVVEGDFTVEGGADAMARLLESQPDVDGVFVASDLMALGAIRTLSERGRRVPADIALVGFDDVREAQLTTPPLTTLRQPLDQLGRSMTRVLLARIGGFDVPQRTVLPTELVRRGTA